MLYSFRIRFRGLNRHADRDQQRHNGPVPVAHSSGELLTGRRQEYAAIRAGRDQALTLQSLDVLDCCGMRHAKPPCNIRGPRLTKLMLEIGDQLRIPIQGGHVFRFDGGQRSDMIPATIPI
jgi:hypothetical protein